MKQINITEHCPSDIILQREGVEYVQPIHMEYFSKTTGMTRGVNIVPPFGYDKAKKYPVMYVLHGILKSYHKNRGLPFRVILLIQSSVR